MMTMVTRRINTRFASAAIGEGYSRMTPEERAARNRWLHDHATKLAQLEAAAELGMRGYRERCERDAPISIDELDL